MSDRSDEASQEPETSAIDGPVGDSESGSGETTPPQAIDETPLERHPADETAAPTENTPAAEADRAEPTENAPSPETPAAPHDTTPLEVTAPLDNTTPSSRTAPIDHAILDRPPGAPFLTARGLSAKGRQGPIFTDITITAALGQVVALCGDGGEGRTSLLLALTGRFAHHTGTLDVDGQTTPRQIRRRFTIAQAGPPIRYDPYATIGACIKETITTSNGAATRTNINAWLDRLAVGADTGDTFGFLPRIEQIRFSIACAAACRTPAIAVDDTDTGLDTCGSERVFEALRTVADAGQLVIATSTRTDPPADTVVDLRAKDPRTPCTRHHEPTRNGGHRK